MNPFEPERYELHTGPAYTFDLNRREMFKLLGGGILILSIISDASAQESGGSVVQVGALAGRVTSIDRRNNIVRVDDGRVQTRVDLTNAVDVSGRRIRAGCGSKVIPSDFTRSSFARFTTALSTRLCAQ